MEREVGGGIGMGKTCEPQAFSFRCMTKFTTKIKKINKKKLIRFVVSRIKNWIEGEFNEGSQKAQTTSYRINKN